jgi:unsaturated rhamnogalacturonyl hydrolase
MIPVAATAKLATIAKCTFVLFAALVAIQANWRTPPSQAGIAILAAAPAGAPLDVARVLAARYPENATMSYISALSWSSAIRLTTLTSEPRWKEKARQQMLPFIAGEKDSAPGEGSLTSLAGYFALFDLGEDAPARKAAELILSTDQAEIIRFAHGWTDDMFMAASLLARVATRKLDDPYSRAVSRLLTTYAAKLQRPDGLFIHAADAPYAWGRGNGFAALALVEALTHLPESWPDRPRVLEIYRRHMIALARYQSSDGSWRQVVDDYASYHELTVTAMTIAAMARGVRSGWLTRWFAPNIDRGWAAVVARLGADGTLRGVCSGTAAGPTKEYYLTRPVINGADDRGGAMALLAAVEIEELKRSMIRPLGGP